MQWIWLKEESLGLYCVENGPLRFGALRSPGLLACVRGLIATLHGSHLNNSPFLSEAVH